MDEKTQTPTTSMDEEDDEGTNESSAPSKTSRMSTKKEKRGVIYLSSIPEGVWSLSPN